MDDIDRLITAFRGEDTARLDNPDLESLKDRIVSDLEANSAEPKVLDFFLAVAANPNEYDLARIEVLKILHVRPFGSEGERDRIGSTLVKLLQNEMDDEVRNYAAMAASSYLAVAGVSDQLERILFDTEADPNLRASAFAAFSSLGPTASGLRVMRAALHDLRFRQSSERVLREWGE